MMDGPPTDIFLPAGQVYFGQGHVRVNTVLGTCVAITLWDPAARRGGMCHYLLPARGNTRLPADSAPGYYADEVMRLFANQLTATRTLASMYVVKVFGGGNMFPDRLTDPDCRNQVCSDAQRAICYSVGCQNISAARRLLASHGFSIMFEDVGGHGSRQLLFDVWSGDVWVKQGRAMTQVDRASR